MPIRLDSRAPDFAERFRALLAAKREATIDVEQTVLQVRHEVGAAGENAHRPRRLRSGKGIERFVERARPKDRKVR